MQQFQLIDLPARIGLVADTHRSSRNPRALPQALLDGLQGCDLILHAGDLNAPWVADVLQRLAPLVAVAGNNDEPQLQRRLDQAVYVQAGKHRIGMVHGHQGRNNAAVNALDYFSAGVDVVVFGHSHMPLVERHGDLLLVNPGSPTQRRRAQRRSYGMMTVDGTLAVEIVPLESGT